MQKNSQCLTCEERKVNVYSTAAWVGPHYNHWRRYPSCCRKPVINVIGISGRFGNFQYVMCVNKVDANVGHTHKWCHHLQNPTYCANIMLMLLFTYYAQNYARIICVDLPYGMLIDLLKLGLFWLYNNYRGQITASYVLKSIHINFDPEVHVIINARTCL